MNFCSKCGQLVKENQKFCSKCGKKLNQSIITNQVNIDNVKSVEQEPKKDENKELEKNKPTGNQSEGLVKEQSVEKKNEELVKQKFVEKQNKELDKEQSVEQQNEKLEKEETQKETTENKNEKLEKQELKKMGKDKHLNKKLKRIMIAGVIILSLLIMGFIFKDTIYSEYYLSKAKHSNLPQEKIELNIKALKNKYSTEALNNIKKIIGKSIKDTKNIKGIEKSLNHAKDILPKELYHKLMVSVCTSKYDKFLNDNKYEQAFSALVQAKKFGYTIKKDKNYEKFMIKLSSKIANINEDLSRKKLRQKGVDFGDLDKDGIDEIVVANSGAKEGHIMKYSNLKINLYKFSSTTYKVYDKQEYECAQQCFNIEIGGANKNTNAIFICGIAGMHGGHDTAYILENGKLKNTMSHNDVWCINPEIPKDINEDGFIEIPSMKVNPSSVEQSYDVSGKIISWYKMDDTGTWILLKQEKQKNKNYYSNEFDRNNSKDYIISNSSTQLLDTSDLSGFSKDKLALARNEIYARHGYVFSQEPFKSYFSSKNWYVPNSNFQITDEELNKIEVANIKFIKQMEDGM